MKKYGLFLLIFLFNLYSCIKYIDIDPPPYESEIFVAAILTEGRQPALYISRTVPLNETELPEALPDALVLLKPGTGPADTLVYDDNDKLFKTTHLPSRNISYSLEVRHNGEKATAQTSFPPSANMEIIEWEETEVPEEEITTDALKIRFRIHDPAGKNFYQIEVYSGNSSRWVRNRLIFTDLNDPAVINEGVNTFSDIFFSDEIFDGQTYDMALYFDRVMQLQPGDSLMVITYALSEYAYRWMKYVHIQNYYGGLFENMEPAFIPDNVDGGLGVFGTRTVDTLYYAF